MSAARMLKAVIGTVFLADIALAQTGPVLRYVFDQGGTQVDVGSAPAADGTLAGSAAVIPVSPAMFTSGALDLTANGASNNYVTSGSDVQKTDGLAELTVTFWINLQAAPAEGDCIISDSPSGYPAEGQGGWEIRITGGDAPATASNFKVGFEIVQAYGGWNGFQGQASPSINADHRWVFVAVTYTSGMLQRFYLGDESMTVQQIGLDSYFSYTLRDNSADLRIGSAASEPSIDRTPPAWIDDVRIYNRALCASDLDFVREENLKPIESVMDFDGDQDIDLADVDIFAKCATGPGIPYDTAALPPGCPLQGDVFGLIAPDLDWDGDVDQVDFALLQLCVGASGVAPPPSCRY